MKKTALILLGACATFISCSEDDNTSVNTAASLQGTWKLTAFNLGEGLDLNNDGTVSDNLITESGCYDNSTIVFGGNNTAVFNIQELDVNLDLVTGSQTQYEYTSDCMGSTPEVATYTSTNNQVAIDFPGTEDDNQPLVLTRSGNTLVSSQSFNVPVNINGNIMYTDVDVDLVFTKQ